MYTYNNSEEAYEKELWKDKIFGGPVTEPLVRPLAIDEHGNKIMVNNSLV